MTTFNQSGVSSRGALVNEALNQFELQGIAETSISIRFIFDKLG